MRFDGPDGRSIELVVVNYQFPPGSRVDRLLKQKPPRGFDDDANWLVIAGTVNDGAQSWQFRCPCLMTTDLELLSGWFDAIADGQTVLDEIGFTEPNLEFSRIQLESGKVAIRVAFELESRPPWGRSSHDDDWGQFWLDFPVSPGALRRAAADLRVQLQRYPKR